MRFIRLTTTVAAVAAVYFAQYIFLHQSLQDFFPQRLLDLFPTLYPITRWLPEDLGRIALWLSAAAILGVGLVAPTWPELSSLANGSRPLNEARRTRLHTLTVLFALLLVSGLGLFLALGGHEGLWWQVAWVAGVLLYLVGARAPQSQPAAQIPLPAQPYAGWRLLGLVLLGAALLFNWPFRTVVPPLSAEIVDMGLQALAWSRGAAIQLFENTQTTFTGLTLLTHALAIRLTGDGLLAARFVGTGAALLTIVATWLIGCELFLRTPMAGPYGELVEDEGRWPALVASALVAANVVMFHFSRLPVYLEPVAWGGLGLWLWLRSVRTGGRLSLALSGVLIGGAALLYQNGLIFLLIMPFWWLGVRLLQPNWLRSSPQVEEGLRTVRQSLLWWGGLWVAVAPLVGIWAHSPALLFNRFPNSWLPDLSQLSVALGLPFEQTWPLDQIQTGQNQLVAPLMLLGIGCLLLNLDRLVGWLMGSWLVVGLVVGSAMARPPQFWPTLAPLLPVLALLVAFTLDRVRTTIVESAGAWAAQAMTYLSVGLILWAVQASWIDYNRFVRTTISPEHYSGFALRRLDPEAQPISFIQPAEQTDLWQLPLIRFLVNDQFADTAVTRYTRADLPATLPAHAVVVWEPAAGAELLREVPARYPGGSLRTRRDQLGNPALYLYELP